MKIICKDESGMSVFITAGDIYETLRIDSDSYTIKSDLGSVIEVSKTRFYPVRNIEDVFEEMKKDSLDPFKKYNFKLMEIKCQFSRKGYIYYYYTTVDWILN